MKRASSCGSLSSLSSSSSTSCNSCNNPNPSEESLRASKIRRTRKVRKQETSSKTHNVNRRSSIYRGVTRHRLTGRYEAHLWDKNCWNAVQNKRGKQVYLGAYDNEEAAAHTYDLAALKYWGTDTALNFPIETYKRDVEEMQKVSKEEYLASLKRRSSGFSRGVSKYRGVARHHHNGRWEARIGRVFGNKYLYLGTFNTQEEAAAAYDMAAIEYRGANAVTNFHISNYIDHFKKKGIPLDTLPSPSEPAVATTTAVTESSEVEQSPEQSALPPEQEQSQPSDLMAMPEWSPLHSHHDDASQTETDDLTWSFCLDSTGLTGPLSTVSDISMESTYKLPDLFQDSGFEDNIHLIFDDNCVTCGVDIATTEEKLLNSPSSSSTTLA